MQNIPNIPKPTLKLLLTLVGVLNLAFIVFQLRAYDILTWVSQSSLDSAFYPYNTTLLLRYFIRTKVFTQVYLVFLAIWIVQIEIQGQEPRTTAWRNLFSVKTLFLWLGAGIALKSLVWAGIISATPVYGHRPMASLGITIEGCFVLALAQIAYRTYFSSAIGADSPKQVNLLLKVVQRPGKLIQVLLEEFSLIPHQVYQPSGARTAPEPVPSPQSASHAGETSRPPKLPKGQVMANLILELGRSKGTFKMRDLTRTFRKHPNSILYHLNKLVKTGHLARKGSRRATVYEVSVPLAPELPKDQVLLG